MGVLFALPVLLILLAVSVAGLIFLYIVLRNVQDVALADGPSVSVPSASSNSSSSVDDPVKEKDRSIELVSLEDMLKRLTQDEIDSRRYLDPSEPSFVPEYGVSMPYGVDREGEIVMSRQMVLSCFACRRAQARRRKDCGVGAC